jgi:hypothetical protein
VKGYRNKGDLWLLSNAPLDAKVTEVIKSVSVVKVGDYSELTFRKYTERAKSIFGDFETKISGQTRRYKRLAKLQFEIALKKAVKKHGYQAFTSAGGDL